MGLQWLFQAFSCRCILGRRYARLILHDEMLSLTAAFETSESDPAVDLAAEIAGEGMRIDSWAVK
jgi:hypothetical protein